MKRGMNGIRKKYRKIDWSSLMNDVCTNMGDKRPINMFDGEIESKESERVSMNKSELKQIVDEIIDKMEQIRLLQEGAGVEVVRLNGKTYFSDARKKFFETADALNGQIQDTGEESYGGCRKFRFVYRGIVFEADINAAFIMDNLELVKEKVLPPTKVTEPIVKSK